MKKMILLLLCFAWTLSLAAQSYTLSVSGLVVSPNGQGMEGATVLIGVPGSNPNGFFYSGTVVTDADGQYADQISIPESITEGSLLVSLVDCDSNLLNTLDSFFIGAANVFVHDFAYCGDAPGTSCTAAISVDYQPDGSAYVQGTVTGTGPLNFGFDPNTGGWSNSSSGSVGTTVTTSGFWCVYVTDSDGCQNSACEYVQIGNPNECSVYVAYDSLNTTGFWTAVANGTAPFTYQWSTGETTQSILWQPNGVNNCVTVTDATGCVAVGCVFTPPGCSAWISENPAGGITASSSGQQPYTYLWNTGETSGTIFPNAFGTYCVTVTNGAGCVDSLCYYYDNTPVDTCAVQIIEMDSAGYTILWAFAGNFFASYQWSTGETGNYIVPTEAGTYCVTAVVSNTCTATTCYDYQLPQLNSTISGNIYLPDSLNANVLDGIVELYQLTPGTTLPAVLVSTVDILSEPNGWWNSYTFGEVAPGTYIIKVSLDAASPLFDDYLPTYYGNVIYWDEATWVGIPGQQTFFSVTLLEGQNLTGDDGGEISGEVTDGNGLTANGDSNRGGAPLENVNVLLLDNSEQPVTHTLTDSEGRYSFNHLPFGTYKIVVEITGLPQGERWVTLNAANPVSEENNFDVNEAGVVNGTSNLVKPESGFEVQPNPASGSTSVRVEATRAFEGVLTLTSPGGQVVSVTKAGIAAGVQHLAFDLQGIPAGLYFLQLNTGTEVVNRKLIVN